MSSPSKIFYTLDEASRFLGIKPYVGRYWDREFSIKKEGGNRREKNKKFHRAELETLARIKKLREEGLTLSGIKKRLTRKEKDFLPAEKDNRLFLLKLKKMLKSLANDLRE